MKIILFTTLILGLIIFVWGQSTNLPQESQITEPQSEQTKCSPTVEGLQLCTTVPSVSVKSGESVPIRLLTKNVSEKTVTVIRAAFDKIYDVTVTDSRGNKVPSISEALAKKNKNNTVVGDGSVENLPINSSPQKIQLAPKQELRTEYNLSNFYDLQAKGKYRIEISRKIAKESGVGSATLSFGTIEVEIK